MINNQIFRQEWPAFLVCRTPEKIENYDLAIADETQTWICHHRLETHNCDGEIRLVELSMEELKALDMYYDRPPEELIFLTKKAHMILHNPSGKRTKKHFEKIAEKNRGKKRSEQQIRKIADAKKKKVMCIETGEIFDSIKDAKGKYRNANISQVCLGHRKTACGYHWKFIQ